MEKVINSYECLFIVDVTKGDEVTEATVNKFLSMIEANAEVVDVAKWGKRRLAYPINDMPEGYYVVATFKAEPDFPSELERVMNIDETLMRSYLESAKALGAPMIRIWGGKKASDQFLRADRAAFVAELKTFASLAKTYGITLALECHRDTITDEYHNTLALLKEVGADNLTSFWQPLQSRTESYNLDSAAAHAPFVRHIHVFHWRDKQKLPLSEAVDTWRSYLSAFFTPRTLLLEFMPDGRLESLAKEAEALRRIVGDES